MSIFHLLNLVRYLDFVVVLYPSLSIIMYLNESQLAQTDN